MREDRIVWSATDEDLDRLVIEDDGMVTLYVREWSYDIEGHAEEPTVLREAGCISLEPEQCYSLAEALIETGDFLRRLAAVGYDRKRLSAEDAKRPSREARP